MGQENPNPTSQGNPPSPHSFLYMCWSSSFLNRPFLSFKIHMWTTFYSTLKFSHNHARSIRLEPEPY